MQPCGWRWWHLTYHSSTRAVQGKVNFDPSQIMTIRIFLEWRSWYRVCTNFLCIRSVKHCGKNNDMKIDCLSAFWKLISRILRVQQQQRGGESRILAFLFSLTDWDLCVIMQEFPCLVWREREVGGAVCVDISMKCEARAPQSVRPQIWHSWDQQLETE